MSEFMADEKHNLTSPPPEGTGAVIAGHRLKPNQWAAFETYWLSGSVEQAARSGSVSPWTIWNWRRSPWWQELFERHVQHHQQDFHSRLARHSKDLADGVIGVASGKDTADKTASARVNAAKLFAEMGEKPLIKKRNLELTYIGNQQNNYGGINLGALKGMTQEELLEMNESGTIPDRMIEGRTGQDPIGIEAEPIQEPEAEESPGPALEDDRF